DLSFLLYKNGPIFVDAGPHSYNYKDPMTQYAYSQYAHSTLIVNDKSLPRTDYKFDKVKITDHHVDQDSQTFKVTGCNGRYENVNHYRTISGNLQEQEFIIEDKVESNQHNIYEFLLQVNDNLTVIQNGYILYIFKNNAKVEELEIAENKNIDNSKISVVTEKQWPQIMGYQFPKPGPPEPMNTIVVEGSNTGTDIPVILLTKIRLKDFKITGSASFERKERVKVQGDMSYIYENYGKRKLVVVFNAVHSPYRYPLEAYDEVFNENDYNILYINDNQSKIGTSFIKG